MKTIGLLPFVHICTYILSFRVLIKSTCLLSSGLNAWLLLLFKSFINNERRTFGLSHYVAVSVTEVSDVDVDFTGAVLMLILYQQRSPIDRLLVSVIIDHIDIGWT